MMKISVIVPMFRVEAYIERCIRSLEKQNIQSNSYEIICIDDGSPDNSGRIVQGLQQEFTNIKLINQENQGVSRARNNGIELASGKYILFVDPDDYVDSNSLKEVLDFAETNSAEVTFLGFTFREEDGSVRKEYFNCKLRGRLYSGPEAYFESREDGQTDPDRMVAVLFDREFLNRNNLRYLPEVPFLEDGEFIARILCVAERCSFYGKSFYQRTTRPGSATNSRLFSSDKATNGFFLCASNLLEFQQTRNLSEVQYQFLNQAICKFVILIVDPTRDPWILLKNKKILKRLKSNNLAYLDLSSVDDEYTVLGKWYNYSVWAFIVFRLISVKFKFFSPNKKKKLVN